MEEYIEELISKLPKVTGIQMEQNALLRANYMSPGFISFINNAYSTILDIFNKCKISEKKRKCNWCRLCAHLHNVFGSQLYREEIMQAFQLKQVTANANAICTRIYFDLLNIVSAKEAKECQDSKLDNYLAQLHDEETLDSLDKSSLRYIAGACIHSVRNSFQRTAMQNVFKDHLKAKITKRTHQLTSRLIGSKTALEAETVEPESLLKLLHNNTGGLLFVTDETFVFFKLLMVKVKFFQNMMRVQIDPQLAYLKAIHNIMVDVDIVNSWLNLFQSEQTTTSCICVENEEDEESIETEKESMADLDLEEVLVLDILQKVVIYFYRVHLNEQVDQLKDFVLEKPKTFQLRHTLDESTRNPSTKNRVEYPCGICLKECIDITSTRNPVFEDFSVQCDKCSKWFHYICQNLTGKEAELKDGSTLPYFCSNCKITQSPIVSKPNESTVDAVSSNEDNEMELDVPIARGRGRGRGRGHARGRAKQSIEQGDNVPTPSVTSNPTCPQTRSRSGRLLKPNKKYET